MMRSQFAKSLESAVSKVLSEPCQTGVLPCRGYISMVIELWDTLVDGRGAALMTRAPIDVARRVRAEWLVSTARYN